MNVFAHILKWSKELFSIYISTTSISTGQHSGEQMGYRVIYAITFFAFLSECRNNSSCKASYISNALFCGANNINHLNK